MFIVIWIGLLGLVIGSFLNALVWRMHESDGGESDSEKSRLSVWHGRSMCPHCRHELRWYDLVPVLSWIILRGKCRDCTAPISIQYPLVELVTAAVFGLSAAVLPLVSIADRVHLVAWLWVAASLIALAVYDLRWYLLPDRILLPALVPVAIDLIVRAAGSGNLTPLWHHVVAALAAAGAFYALTVVSGGRWMGGGDVKLLLLMGLLLGPAATILALFVAFDAAALVGVSLILAGKKTRKDYLPFGPFLAGGTIIGCLWGSNLVGAYLAATGISI